MDHVGGIKTVITQIIHHDFIGGKIGEERGGRGGRGGNGRRGGG